MEKYFQPQKDDFIDLSSIQRDKKADVPDVVKPTSMKINMKDVKSVHKSIIKQPKEKEKENDAVDKRRLVLILELYLVEFPKQLEPFKGTKFNSKSIEELMDIMNQMDGIISSKSCMKQTQKAIVSGIRTIEFVATYATPIKCQGLSEVMLNNPETLDDIKHIALKRMSMASVDPEIRLAYNVLQNMLMLHNINSNQNQVRPVEQDKISQIKKVNNDFNDL
jgi:hypothetical protein